MTLKDLVLDHDFAGLGIHHAYLILEGGMGSVVAGWVIGVVGGRGDGASADDDAEEGKEHEVNVEF